MLNDWQLVRFLADARELIVRGWTTGAYVRSSAGYAVPIDARSIRRVCVAGAIDRVGVVNGLTLDEREQLRTVLDRALLGEPTYPAHALALERWNDAGGRTRADVLDLYDRAIAGLRTALVAS